MLYEFLDVHRDELIARTKAKVLKRSSPAPTDFELAHGVPLFLTQLAEILRSETEAHGKAGALHSSNDPGEERVRLSAGRHGGDLLKQGFTIAQVVHDYGDVCQAVTELAVERRERISPEDFHTLNRCLDNAIASAVTEYGRQRGQQELERQGFFAHELRNHLNTGLLALESLASGRVGVTGSTMEVLKGSFRGIGGLIDRSISEIRVSSGMQHQERLRVAEILEEIEIAGQMEAKGRNIQLTIEQVAYELCVQADRQLLSSAISNLLQNAIKFTPSDGRVWLRTRSTAGRVAVEVEDQCGGLDPKVAAGLFHPFEQGGNDHTGLGLGLSISRRAARASGGDIAFVNMPGKGCIFTIDLPLAAPKDEHLRH